MLCHIPIHKFRKIYILCCINNARVITSRFFISSVLNSKRAIHVNIQIIRVFTKLREIMSTHKDLARRIEDLERTFQEKFQEHDKKIILIFNAIKNLI